METALQRFNENFQNPVFFVLKSGRRISYVEDSLFGRGTSCIASYRKNLKANYRRSGSRRALQDYGSIIPDVR